MSGTQFTIRRKIFSILGAKFHIYREDGTLLGFCNQKAFKLKEDIRIYTDESMSEERLRIAARQMIDISAAYNVFDSKDDSKIGALQRRGLKSILRDEWNVMDENDQPIGTVQEDSTAMALLRRFVSNLVPQSYHLKQNGGRQLAEFRTHFNPFIHRMTVTVYPECPVHPFLVLASCVLLMTIEGRQE